MKSKAPKYVPSVEEYKSAFQKIEKQMTKNQRRMLEKHYESYCYVSTATDLAILMDYGGAGGTKLQYGRLGSLVSNALGLGSLGVITLVLMVPPKKAGNPEWLWVMRANVAVALEQLGWVKKRSRFFYPQGPVGSEEYF